MGISRTEPLAFELQGLRGGWNGTTIVEDIWFAVQAGETFGIVGRNGVGKSTLLELIAGRALRLAGKILVDGRDIAAMPIHHRALAGLGYVPQQREVFPNLTVQEHLRVANRPGPWTAQRLYSLFPSLANRQESTGRQLSGGEQQMLAIARALISNPKVLLMDEPSEGLAPVVIEQLVSAIQRVLADRSLVVVLVEQRLDVALALSTTCLVMDRGRIVHQEPAEALRDDPTRLPRLMGLES